MPTPTITQELRDRVLKDLIESFKDLKGFSHARASTITNMYDTDGSNVAYYEAKLVDISGAPCGYAVLSATEDDLPVVEFSESAQPYSERFAAKIGHSNFRMIWFDPAYVTAEDAQGKLLAEIGDRPTLMPKNMYEKKSRGEGGNRYDVSVRTVPLRVLPSQVRRVTNWSHAELKRAFIRRRPSPRLVQSAWSAVKSPNSPCVTSEYGPDMTSTARTYFLQIAKNTPPNNNDHASGCGPTAWMNLFGWHDKNWCNTILQGSTTYNDATIDNLTMELHDRLGTYEPWWTFGADGGFTWPGDMGKGIDFAKSRFGHDCGYWYRYDWWNTDEPWVFRVARDAARSGRPFIVGYYSDRHYAIGYKIRECTKHGWQEHSWIRIYPAWDTNDSDDKWIPMGTIFGIWAVYDFYPLPSGSVGQHIASYDWSSGWTSAEFYVAGGNTYLFLLKKEGGIVHIHRMNGDGTVGARIATHDWSDNWTVVRPFTVGTSPFLFLLKTSDGTVHIHKLNSDGTVGSQVATYDWSSGWTSAEFYVAAGNTCLFLLKESNGIVHVHRINTDGSVGTQIDERDWTDGWTSVRVFSVGASRFLFLLKRGDGTVHIHKII